LGLNQTDKISRLTDPEIDAILFGSPAPELTARGGDRVVDGAPEHQERTEDASGDAEVRVHSASLLWIKESALAIEARCARLERVLERRNGELRRARQELAVARRATHDARLETIDRLVAAAEEKDHETAAHIERIGQYAEVIARALDLPQDHVEMIRAAAPMHDVGKLGVPDAVLKKDSGLTSVEWGIMKQHTVIGARMLEGSASPLLQAGAAIALSHHERWDGAGYPYGISGEEIPLEARICAVADVYDALSSNRCYREALPSQTVREMMESQRGRHFDPSVLDAFLGSRTAIDAIQSKF
jgi:putative two-component system response regulator